MAQAAELLAAGVKVIDLAADFRLQDLATFERWYGMSHACPELLREAAYGLPELNREAIRAARIVGNPGCYPTSVQLGLAPLLRTPGLVDASHLIANCASGVSGAGRKAEVGSLFAEAADSFKAYGVKGHRHGPEINEQLRRIAGVAGDDASVHCIFVPHLIPIIRGIHSTLYARLTPQGQATDLQALFEDFYRGEPFVDVMPAGSAPETRSVRASNVARMAVHKPAPDTVMVLVVEDNLTKGASGQAVQCMNLLFDLPETTGLMQRSSSALSRRSDGGSHSRLPCTIAWVLRSGASRRSEAPVELRSEGGSHSRLPCTIAWVLRSGASRSRDATTSRRGSTSEGGWILG